MLSTGGNPVPGTWTTLFNSGDYSRLVFTPGTNLTASTMYTVTYNSQLLNEAENPLVNPGSIVFTTGTTTDITHGSVTFTDPQYNETGVGTNIDPSFDLNKIVDPITVDDLNAFIQNYNTGKTIAGAATVSADRMHVTITPSAALQPGTYYYAFLGSGHQFQDLAGNYLNGTTLFFTISTRVTHIL